MIETSTPRTRFSSALRTLSLLTLGLLFIVRPTATSNVAPITITMAEAAIAADSIAIFSRTLDKSVDRLLSFRKLVEATESEVTDEVTTDLAGYLPVGIDDIELGLTRQESLEFLSFGIDEGAWMLESRLFESAEARIERGKAIRSLPLSVPVAGTVTSGFGVRNHPILRGRRMHKGLDIAAPTGTEIYAPGGGVVTFSGRKGGYGNTIIIDHGNGYTTLYGHCSKLLVEEGARVSRDDVVALVGSTGRSTGPHLHYEVRIDGVHMNPTEFILYERDQIASLRMIADWYLTM